jgi:hypothetical protein
MFLVGVCNWLMALEVCRLNEVGMIVVLHSQYPSFRSSGQLHHVLVLHRRQNTPECTAFRRPYNILLYSYFCSWRSTHHDFHSFLISPGSRVRALFVYFWRGHHLSLSIDSTLTSTHHDCTRAIPWPRRTSPRGVSPWPTCLALARRLSKIRSRRLLRPNYGDLVAWVSW